MVATSHALRVVGCPGLELWQALLPHRPKMRFLEDNQAMLQCVKTGRNPTMRHLARTHRVSVGWIHEQYRSGHFIFAHESGERMPPDIFTKMFADKSKWKAARMLINVVLPEEIKQVMEEGKEIFAGIQEKPAMPARSKCRRKRNRGNGGSSAVLDGANRLSSNGGHFSSPAQNDTFVSQGAHATVPDVSAIPRSVHVAKLPNRDAIASSKELWRLSGDTLQRLHYKRTTMFIPTGTKENIQPSWLLPTRLTIGRPVAGGDPVIHADSWSGEQCCRPYMGKKPWWGLTEFWVRKENIGDVSRALGAGGNLVGLPELPLVAASVVKPGKLCDGHDICVAGTPVLLKVPDHHAKKPDFATHDDMVTISGWTIHTKSYISRIS